MNKIYDLLIPAIQYNDFTLPRAAGLESQYWMQFSIPRRAPFCGEGRTRNFILLKGTQSTYSKEHPLAFIY